MTEVHDRAELCFPQLFNTSCRRPPLSWSGVLFLRFLLSSICVPAVLLNLLVIISVSHFRQLHKPTNLLLLSLAVSDCAGGLVFLPGEIFRQTACWFLGDYVCSLYKYGALLTVCTSVGNMVLISVDRYMAVCDPLHYPTRVTVRTAKQCILLSWLYSVLYGSYIIQQDFLQREKHNSCYGECVIVVSYIVGAVDLVLFFILPVTVIIVLYIRVFVVAVSHARAMRSQITAMKLQHSGPPTAKKSELKAARTLGIVVVAFLMCFCPYYCVLLAGHNLFHISVFVTCLICFNSCLNPVIYALFYPWFRKAIKLIVTLQILQPGSCEANIL